MIISRTPMRISFVGGGSDLPSHYREHGGAVVSVSINKYVFITVNKRFDSTIRVSYSKTEEVASAAEIEHSLVRASLGKLELTNGLEITSIADIPSKGTGLGSSSAFTVGLLNSLYAYKGIYRSRSDLAAEACEVEINLCKEPIGKQDQYAAAIGGFNYLKFNPDDSVFCEPVIGPSGFIDSLQRSLLLFYTGITRSASELLKRQSDEMTLDRNVGGHVVRMASLATDFIAAVHTGDLRAAGEIMHEGWSLKRRFSSVTNDVIDNMYHRSREAGGIGGKLLGAGGGGFMLVLAPPERHPAIRAALSEFRCVPFRFDWGGSTIIFYYPSDE